MVAGSIPAVERSLLIENDVRSSKWWSNTNLEEEQIVSTACKIGADDRLYIGYMPLIKTNTVRNPVSKNEAPKNSVRTKSISLDIEI
jgi:hypothetical protein